MSEETMNDNRKEETYSVMAWVTVGGRIEVKAYSQQDAEDIIESMIDEDEVEFINKVDVTHREWEVLL